MPMTWSAACWGLSASTRNTSPSSVSCCSARCRGRAARPASVSRIGVKMSAKNTRRGMPAPLVEGLCGEQSRTPAAAGTPDPGALGGVVRVPVVPFGEEPGEVFGVLVAPGNLRGGVAGEVVGFDVAGPQRHKAEHAAEGLAGVQGLAGGDRDVVALEDELVVVVEAVADRRGAVGTAGPVQLVQLQPVRAACPLPHQGLVVHHLLHVGQHAARRWARPGHLATRAARRRLGPVAPSSSQTDPAGPTSAWWAVATGTGRTGSPARAWASRCAVGNHSRTGVGIWVPAASVV